MKTVLWWLMLVMASCESRPAYAQINGRCIVIATNPPTIECDPTMKKPKPPRLLWGSMAALIAAQGADTWTTLACRPGCYERNPLGLGRAMAIKWTATPALLVAEHYAAKDHPKRARWFVVVNAGLSLEFGWAAWHNAKLHRWIYDCLIGGYVMTLTVGFKITTGF